MSSFSCPQCSGDTMVKDSRPATATSGIRRRRHCTVCHHRFSTFEMAIGDGPTPILINMVDSLLRKTESAMDGLADVGREADRVRELLSGLKDYEERKPT